MNCNNDLSSKLIPTQESTFLIDELPENIIKKIFSYLNKKELSSCSFVCKKWNNYSLKPLKDIYFIKIKKILLQSIFDFIGDPFDETRRIISLLAKNKSFDLAINLADSLPEFPISILQKSYKSPNHERENALRDIAIEFFSMDCFQDGLELLNRISNENIKQSGYIILIKEAASLGQFQLAHEYLGKLNKFFFLFGFTFIYLFYSQKNSEQANNFIKDFESELSQYDDINHYLTNVKIILNSAYKDLHKKNYYLQVLEEIFQSYLIHLNGIGIFGKKPFFYKKCIDHTLDITLRSSADILILHPMMFNLFSNEIIDLDTRESIQILDLDTILHASFKNNLLEIFNSLKKICILLTKSDQIHFAIKIANSISAFKETPSQELIIYKDILLRSIIEECLLKGNNDDLVNILNFFENDLVKSSAYALIVLKFSNINIDQAKKYHDFITIKSYYNIAKISLYKLKHFNDYDFINQEFLSMEAFSFTHEIISKILIHYQNEEYENALNLIYALYDRQLKIDNII